MRRLGVLACTLVTLTSCAGSAGEALQGAATKLQEVRSGVVSFRVEATAGEDGRVGFVVEGPFSADQDRPLPVVDWEVTRILGEEEDTVRFISTGDEAFIERDGQAYALDADQSAGLGGPQASLAEGLSTIDLSDWFVDGEAEEGEGETVLVGDLDVVAAANDLMEMSGAGLPAIEGEEAESLRASVRSSTLRLVVDGDGYPRELQGRVVLGPEVPERFAQLGELAGAVIELEFTLQDPNEPVEVTAPEDALPL